MEETSYVNILREFIVPEAKPWVVFAYGTFVFPPKGDEIDLEESAKHLLKEWGVKYSQTSSFLELEKGWIVQSEHDDIATVISKDELGDDADATIIHIIGRQKRFQDAEELTVIHVEE